MVEKWHWIPMEICMKCKDDAIQLYIKFKYQKHLIANHWNQIKDIWVNQAARQLANNNPLIKQYDELIQIFGTSKEIRRLQCDDICKVLQII